jgi:hypothetical protein
MAILSARPAGEGAKRNPCGGIMANKPQDLWYVSFELPRVGKRPFARGASPCERAACSAAFHMTAI